MKAMWNERYADKEYFYGIEPNRFLQTVVGILPNGANILCIGEGEGRNAVFLSTLGHKVCAVDFSIEAKKKAEELARKHGVSIDYQVCTLEDFNFGENRWDAIISIFCHLPQTIRGQVHKHIESALKMNGLFISQAYSPEQLDFQSGGPKDPTMLYSESMIRSDFPKFHWVRLQRVLSEILEGKGHTGLSSVINGVGLKIDP